MGYGASAPETKREMEQLIKDGHAEGFHLTRYPRGHQATDFARWFKDSEGEYEAKYEVGFEPYVVARRSDVPQYDARFRGYGLNKVAHLYRMGISHHFKFIVNTDT